MKYGMIMAVSWLALIASGIVTMQEPCAKDTSFVRHVVIIDPGHTDKKPGAISVTGIFEVAYNDNIAYRLAKALNDAGFVSVLTRKHGQEITLEDRAAIANSHHALAMISIHHDSAQPVLLESVHINGKNAYRTLTPISGYSIFISAKNPEFDKSLSLAKLLGKELLKLGRPPTLHHAEPIPGEGRTLLDAELGIYLHDELVVLKKTTIPAVLLEVGVIVDPADEAYLSKTDHQQAIVHAMTTSLQEFKNGNRNRN